MLKGKSRASYQWKVRKVITLYPDSETMKVEVAFTLDTDGNFLKIRLAIRRSEESYRA